MSPFPLNASKGPLNCFVRFVSKNIHVEKILPWPSRDGTGLDIRHINGFLIKMGKDAVQGTWLMGQGHDKGHFICLGTDFFFLSNNDKAGIIALICLDTAHENCQAIGFCGFDASHGSKPSLFPFGDHTGSFRRIAAGNGPQKGWVRKKA